MLGELGATAVYVLQNGLNMEAVRHRFGRQGMEIRAAFFVELSRQPGSEEIRGMAGGLVTGLAVTTSGAMTVKNLVT